MPKAHGIVLRCGLWLGAFVCVAGAAAGQTPPTLSAGDPISPLEEWRNRAAETRRLLEAGESQQAFDLVDPLVHEMMNSNWIKPGTESTLAQGVFLRAVAHAGLGHREAAAWDWSTARTLDPASAGGNLASFGKAGQFLEEIRTSPKEEVQSVKKLEESSRADVLRPRKISGAAPAYPLSRKRACQDGAVVVEALLDEQGIPRNPSIVQSPHPAFSLAALEALQGWRFEPARFKGEIVKVDYTLTIHFKVKNCNKQAS